MNSNLLHDAGMIGSGVTVTSGLMLWFDSHAGAIGLLLTFISIVMTFIFMYLNYKLNLKRLDFDRRKVDEK